MRIETLRLELREWLPTDAGSLYRYASDARIGTAAGWSPHKSIAESEDVIRNIFMQPGVFAITMKGSDEVIGCIGVITGRRCNLDIPDDEGEISYWIGVPFWGKGLIPEAVMAIVRHSFEDLKLKVLWCSCYEGNHQSLRVQEKCGFQQHHMQYPDNDELNDGRMVHVSRLIMPLVTSNFTE